MVLNRKNRLVAIALVLLFTLLFTAPVSAAGTPSISNRNISVAVGDAYDLNIRNVSKGASFEWTTSNAKIANVNKDGLVKGISKGSAVITCKVKSSGKSYSVTSQVNVILDDDNNSLIITSKELTNGMLTLSGQSYTNITILSSVGNAVIKLDNVTVSGSLVMENGSDYKIKIVNSTVSSAEFISPSDAEKITSDTLKPTLIVGENAVIRMVKMKASSNLELNTAGKIENLAVSPDRKGVYEMSLIGYQGNILVDYDTEAISHIILTGCSIDTVNLKKARGENILFTGSRENKSTINKLLMKTGIFTILDVDTNIAEIDPNTPEADFYITAPVQKLINHGAIISITMAENGNIKEVINNPGKNGSYGIYDFLDDKDKWSSAFSISIGEKHIDGVRVKDFAKIFAQWPDKSKPLTVPEDNFSATFQGENKYLFNFNGQEVTMDVDLERSVITVYCDKNIILSDVCTAHDK